MSVTRGRPSRLTVYKHLEEAIDDLRSRMGGLPSPTEAEQIWSELWHQEAHHSTALEGNTLILDEVRKLLDEGRAVGSKELKEYMEVVGYGAGAQWVYGQAMDPGDWTTGELLSLQEVRTVHHKVMTPVWDVAPHPHATSAEAPGSWRAHDIAPFPEGTGRLLLNLLLVRLGYPPAIVFKNERTKYLKMMRKADDGDYGPLGELIARAVMNNLYRFIVPAVAGPARLVPLASLVDAEVGITATSLRGAATRGRLRAQKTDTGTWMSSKNWVAEYQNSKYKRTSEAPAEE